jgi:hypothetical protein
VVLLALLAHKVLTVEMVFLPVDKQAVAVAVVVLTVRQVRELLAVMVAQDLMRQRFAVHHLEQLFMLVVVVVAVRQAVLAVQVVAVIEALQEQQTQAVAVAQTQQQEQTTLRRAVRE